LGLGGSACTFGVASAKERRISRRPGNFSFHWSEFHLHA
jgi:hypothetical protein